MLETAYLEFQDFRELIAAPAKNTADSQKLLLGKTHVALNKGSSKLNTPPVMETKVLKVPFQPSSLNFQAGNEQVKEVKGDITKPETIGSQKRENAMPAEASKMRLTFQLVFDRSLYEDQDVTSQVEGFLAAARNPFTRQVSFNWGELYYKGMISSMQVHYEMFGEMGEPIRAKVEVSMDVDNEMNFDK